MDREVLKEILRRAQERGATGTSLHAMDYTERLEREIELAGYELVRKK